MTQFIEAYPFYGTQEEKDLWQQRFADQHNQLVTAGTGSGGSTTTDGLTVNDNGEVVDADENRLGYASRYLYVRSSSDANGATLVNPSSYTGANLFVQVF